MSRPARGVRSVGAGGFPTCGRGDSGVAVSPSRHASGLQRLPLEPELVMKRPEKGNNFGTLVLNSAHAFKSD